jgi:hypothetical protein
VEDAEMKGYMTIQVTISYGKDYAHSDISLHADPELLEKNGTSIGINVIAETIRQAQKELKEKQKKKRTIKDNTQEP